MTAIEETIYCDAEVTDARDAGIYLNTVLNEENRGSFLNLCQEASETILSGVERYQRMKKEAEAEYGAGKFNKEVSVELCRFDRTHRAQRKLDSAIREFFAGTAEDDNVTVYPYVKEIPTQNAFQTLVDIRVPDGGYSISIVRFLSDLDFNTDGSMIPNTSVYMMLIEPLKAQS